MAIREPNEMLPTMKVEADKNSELDIAFSECQAEIVEVKDVSTKLYGTKTIAILKNDKLKKFNVFLNNYSIELLVKKFGNNDDNWKGKLVNLKMEKDKVFNKNMIVLKPVA